MPHLSYVGDATIGEDTNIGAATVFVNYDGVHKHRTTIGERAFVPAADTMLVAPVDGRRRRLHGGGQRDHQGRAAGRARRGPGAAAQHRGLGGSASGPARRRGAQARAAGREGAPGQPATQAT